MSDPIIGDGAASRGFVNNGSGLGRDGQPISETRDELLARLRANLGWVSASDHSVAVDLDGIIHKLEVLALDDVKDQLDTVTAQRDAAYADLWRIYKITSNPMMEYSDRIKSMFKAVESSRGLDTVIIDQSNGGTDG